MSVSAIESVRALIRMFIRGTSHGETKLAPGRALLALFPRVNLDTTTLLCSSETVRVPVRRYSHARGQAAALACVSNASSAGAVSAHVETLSRTRSPARQPVTLFEAHNDNS